MQTNIDTLSKALTDSIVALSNVHQTEKELLEFVKAYESDEKLRQVLSDATLPFENRVAIVEQIVSGSLPSTKAVLTFLVASEMSKEIPEIVRTIINLTTSYRGANVAFITTAFEISDAQIEEIKQALEASTERAVEVHVEVDETLLGGINVQLGDTNIDGTLISRLNQIRSK